MSTIQQIINNGKSHGFSTEEVLRHLNRLIEMGLVEKQCSACGELPSNHTTSQRKACATQEADRQ